MCTLHANSAAEAFDRILILGLRGGLALAERAIHILVGMAVDLIVHLRRGFDGLSAQVQNTLQQQPFSGHVFVFRGRRGDIVKLLWWDGDGLCLFAKRLERGRFIWPKVESGTVQLSRAQLSMLLEGIDWRRVERTWTPEVAV